MRTAESMTFVIDNADRIAGLGSPGVEYVARENPDVTGENAIRRLAVDADCRERLHRLI